MRALWLAAVVSVMPLSVLAADAGAAAPVASPTVVAKADLKDAKGKAMGTVTVRTAAKGLIFELDLKNVPAGEHAFHLHETGKCEAPFKTAGGHFNPSGSQHGIANPQGQHAGDLPNLHVPKSGQLQQTLFVHGLTVEAGANSIFDADGSAIVIHAGKDDYAAHFSTVRPS